MERVDKILANMGFGTRKEVKKLVRSGAVTLNGEVIKNSDIKIDEYNQLWDKVEDLVKRNIVNKSETKAITKIFILCLTSRRAM